MTNFQLTSEQQSIVQHSSGHTKIIAVAGSGKTATLTHFIEKRLQEGVDPKRILVLMYNTAAQSAFLEKQRRLSQTDQIPEIRTFHSLGLKIYHRLMREGVLPQKNMRPLSQAEIELQFKHLLEQLAPPKLKQEISDSSQEWIDLCTTLLTLSKAQLDGPKAAFSKLKLPKTQHFLIQIIEAFENWRGENQRISFDDMLYDPAKLFQDKPEATRPFTNQMDWILVDEYQDINAIQHYLLHIIAGKRAKVAAIGDPDQTIYEFRGSAPQFILSQFQQDFSQTIEYPLSYTFRFGHTLALTANNLISHNERTHQQLTISHPNTHKTDIKLSRTNDYGEKITSTIEHLQKKGADLSGIAVLCRLWSFARPIELQLLARGLPYKMEGAPSIFSAREIQPLLTTLMLDSITWQNLEQQEQQHRLFQLLATPSPKISHAVLKTIAKHWLLAMQNHSADKALISVAHTQKNPYHKNRILEIGRAIQKSLRCKKAAQRLKIYLNERDVLANTSALALNRSDGMDQIGAIQALVTYLSQKPTHSVETALEELETLQNQKQNPSERCITLTTVHRSKGLEWPVVFIPSIIESHFPYLEQKANKSELEGERRLLYVAMTRAQRHLFMTAPLADEGKKTSIQDSRFLKEMRLKECTEAAAQLENAKGTINLSADKSAVTQKYLKQVTA